MNEIGGLRARLWGIVFLAVIGGAVALLIAGYGVAVGLGALVGLILGFAAGALGLMWLARGSGRSVVVGGMNWSSDGPSEEHVAELHELSEMSEMSSIDLGAILSVRPVLVTTEAGGLSVQLVAIEQHEAGLAMTLAVRLAPGSVRPSSMARVSVSDDAGTSYRASAQAEGGSAGLIRYLVAAIPACPGSATRLNIEIERFFDPFPEYGRATVGPWAFSVTLD